LRREAEVRVTAAPPTVNFPVNEIGLLKLVHELQVYQVELELQNSELEDTRRALEEKNRELAHTVQTLRDEIRDRKRLQQELHEKELEQLEALQALREREMLLVHQGRLASMGEMINNIAHQWRQPLNVLGLIAQKLPLVYQRGNLTKELLDADVGKICETVQFMSQTVEDFRNFFRTDKEKVSFNVVEVVHKALSLVQWSFERQKIKVDVRVVADPVIAGFSNEFSQVLLNIIQNAHHVIQDRHIDDPEITVEIGSLSGRAYITISDNAGGISEEIMERIFDPYFTTRGSEGTGIGLFISKTIVERHMQGTLTVRNTERGAEFRIEVEAVDPS